MARLLARGDLLGGIGVVDGGRFLGAAVLSIDTASGGDSSYADRSETHAGEEGEVREVAVA